MKHQQAGLHFLLHGSLWNINNHSLDKDIYRLEHPKYHYVHKPQPLDYPGKVQYNRFGHTYLLHGAESFLRS